ncbi:MAG: hypothetical protein LBS55_02910 [Prevotellaceae bacterium]|jgi:hypothetical protein|nr:hypothetical protein [Prevotellaceae bacterium]
MKYKTIFVITFFVFFSFTLDAQNDSGNINHYKNEVGIDISNVITVLSKKPESYLLNYKRYFNKNWAIRTGLDIEWSTSNDGYKGLKNKIGYERNRIIGNWKWQFSYGTDVSFLYRANNFQPNKTIRGGVHPFIGFAHYFVKQFSLATELNLNFFCSRTIKPNSFDADDNKTVFEMSVGSVGMILICYHF